MLSNLRNKLALLLSTAILVLAPMVATSLVSADANISNNVCSGTDLQLTQGGSSNCSSDTSGTDKINGIVNTVVNLFSWIVGVVAVIMIIVGGFRYITSGGDSAKVGTAKTTIIYAIIGLIIVALAQIVVKFVLAKTLNASGTSS